MDGAEVTSTGRSFHASAGDKEGATTNSRQSDSRNE